MNEISTFAEMILVVAAAFSLALFGRSVFERIAIPSAALFLVAAAVASDLFASARGCDLVRDRRADSRWSP